MHTRERGRYIGKQKKRICSASRPNSSSNINSSSRGPNRQPYLPAHAPHQLTAQPQQQTKQKVKTKVHHQLSPPTQPPNERTTYAEAKNRAKDPPPLRAKNGGGGIRSVSGSVGRSPTFRNPSAFTRTLPPLPRNRSDADNRHTIAFFRDSCHKTPNQAAAIAGQRTQ